MSEISAQRTLRQAGNGLIRRDTLTVGALFLLGGFFNQPNLLALERNRSLRRLPVKATSLVLIYLQGGPPTQDMFDLKPDAPAGIRSEFKPIASSAAGYDHTGDRASLWGFLRLSLERGSPGDGERGEDIDMNGFGFRIWNAEEK